MTDLLQRITDLLSWTTYGPGAFADEIGVPRPVVSHVLTGRNKASLEVVQKILTRFNEVSPIWLLTGEGEMLVNPSDLSKPPVRRIESAGKEGMKGSQAEGITKKVVNQIEESSLPVEISDTPAQEKKLVKVILLYSDGSFTSYEPS